MIQYDHYTAHESTSLPGVLPTISCGKVSSPLSYQLAELEYRYIAQVVADLFKTIDLRNPQCLPLQPEPGFGKIGDVEHKRAGGEVSGLHINCQQSI